MWDAEVDIAIAGAGGCGLVAALTAAETDLQIAVFEKTDFILGNTAASAGMIPAAGTRYQREIGIQETPEEMAEDILKKNHQESNPDLTLALSKVSGPLVEWMNYKLDMQFSLVTEFKYPGHRNLRMHAPPTRSGLELIKKFKKAANEKDNIYLMLKSQVEKLILGDQGEVIGVHVQTTDGLQHIKAKKVILATNGFGGNASMVKKFIPEISDALYFGYEANTGEGIEMAQEVGADVSNMTAYQGHAAVNEATGLLVTWGTIMSGGFMVNQDGERFGNEAQGYSEFALEVVKQEVQNGYIIIDQDIYQNLLSIEDFKQLYEMDAFKSSDSIEDLAVKLGISIKGLKQTYTAFQKNEQGSSDQFGRTEFPKQLAGKLYGIKVSPALFHTQGGLNVNDQAQVINDQGNVIENLYAGGGTAVGVSGRHAYGYMSGNGLLAALGFGKIAGDHAVHMIQQKGME